MYEKYAGFKSINIVEGNHNSARPYHLVNKVVNFFVKYLYENKNNEDNNEYEEKDKEKNFLFLKRINDLYSWK